MLIAKERNLDRTFEQQQNCKKVCFPIKTTIIVWEFKLLTEACKNACKFSHKIKENDRG